ncbi:MAG: aspartate/glutamate racemase family protein [Burkholderiaceae bacterium]|jgi:Asp/Glu/hydantoin racemase|nr:aspartate/glutamate racemase family protein [Burkholderiaceae bacterium]
MKTLLLLNPNTSAEVSALLQRHAAPEAQAAGLSLAVATARFGPRYISGEAGAAVAGHAALDAYAAHVLAHGRPAAVLLACFGDPGLFALRAVAGAPVVGLAEAAMQAAAQRGPFVVVTGGPAWVPMLQRLASVLPLPSPLLGVQALARSGGELAADPQAAVGLLHGAAVEALARWPAARSVLLGGAGLAGLATPLAGRLPCPVLDNLELALQAAVQAAGQAMGQAAEDIDAPARSAEPGPWNALSPELTRWLAAA